MPNRLDTRDRVRGLIPILNAFAKIPVGAIPRVAILAPVEAKAGAIQFNGSVAMSPHSVPPFL